MPKHHMENHPNFVVPEYLVLSKFEKGLLLKTKKFFFGINYVVNRKADVELVKENPGVEKQRAAILKKDIEKGKILPAQPRYSVPMPASTGVVLSGSDKQVPQSSIEKAGCYLIPS